jgi:class 3 adenylate cyclase
METLIFTSISRVTMNKCKPVGVRGVKKRVGLHRLKALSSVSAWGAILVALLMAGLFWFSVKDILFAWEIDSLSIRQRLFSLPPRDRSQITPMILVSYDSKTEASDTFSRLFGNPMSRSAPTYATRFFRRAHVKNAVFDMSFNGGVHRQDRAGDQALVDSLQGADNIASALVFSQEPQAALDFRQQSPADQATLRKNAVEVEGLQAFPLYAQRYQFSSLVPPYSALLASPMHFYAANSSVVKANIDSETTDFSGDSRRWSPFALYGNNVFPTLALGAVLKDQKKLRLSPEGLLSWPSGQVHIGTSGLPLIKWYGHGAYPQRPVYPEVSFWDVILSEIVLECRENPTQAICHQLPLPAQPPLDPAQFRNKYVLVGITLINAGDTHRTIYNAKYFGLYILANTLDNVLHDDFVQAAPLWLNVLFLLLLPGLLVTMGLRSKSVPLIILLTVTLAAGHFLLCIFAYNRLNLWLYAVYPILALLACFSGLFIYRFLKEQKQRAQLRFAFGKYVAPSVMEIIEKHPEKVCLGGERREMTFMFSDIRGFTSFSDHNPPEVVQRFLTQYFSIMNALILREYHGSINKLIGDAIMAYWGFPLEHEDHAFLAVSAAMAMRDALKIWQQDTDKPPINIGIGINTGDAVIGNVGSEDFMDFTVIGDAVNVASRLESANKEYGTNIIISAATYEKLKTRLEVRPLGFVKLRGKENELEIFEPIRWIS